MTPPDGCDRLLVDCHAATMADAGAPYGIIEDAALAISGGRISWVGPRRHLPGEMIRQARATDHLNGRWITPGLIDCHTHLVFAGNRADEFEVRLKGATYEDIARAGGGILSTVRVTRAATHDELLAQAEARLRWLCREGVTTVEIKSGYGLELEAELRMLRVARALGEKCGVAVVTSFLGLHALPPEFARDRAGYVDLVVDEMLPAIAAAGLADAVDAYCEPIAFGPGEVARLFEKARALKLPVKLHADQLSDSSGAALAARFNALSADHLEYADPAGIAALAKAGTVGVLLPGAFLMLGETRRPPVVAMRALKVPMALATDCNPGTSPLLSLLAAMNLACVLFRFAPEEALAGVTRNAARALGRHGDIGTLEAGKAADLAVWEVGHPAELSYWLGGNPCDRVYFRGELRRS